MNPILEGDVCTFVSFHLGYVLSRTGSQAKRRLRVLRRFYDEVAPRVYEYNTIINNVNTVGSVFIVLLVFSYEQIRTINENTAKSMTIFG